jgi:CubicO group peptidase (beta-lactamase class C family)
MAGREAGLDRVANLVVGEGAAPAASVATARRTARGWQLALGAAGEALLPGEAAIFDLASVTKPFVATAAARLAARGMMSLVDPLARLLPAARWTPSAEVPLILLLAHRAGLDAHRSLFAPLVVGRPFERRAALREAALARRADANGPLPEGGFPPLYSDLGYVLAGVALEHVSGLALDALVEREVLAPLELDIHSARGYSARDAGFLARVLPTETVVFRGGIVRGAVHDENAWALAGYGLAGQAGLFGTAEAVARFGMALLDAAAGRERRWLTAAELEPLLSVRPGGSLRAGFDGKSGTASSAGSRASDATFGHLGFTGTSLWCDPLADRVSVLLSNRVCPTRDNVKLRALRPVVHDALFAWPEAGMTSPSPAPATEGSTK